MPSEENTTSPRLRVLIVDDEASLARTMKMLLEPYHDVVVENDANAALARLERHEPYDVLLCDLHMPEVSGMEMYERLERTQPEVAQRMVFMSGGAYTTAARSFLAQSRNVMLEKPIRPELLLRTVEEVAQRLGARETAAPARQT